MTTFLLDLWQDLRAKRLWPVAVALAAGLVAIPVLLIKPTSAPEPAPVPHADAGAKLPAVTLDASSVDNSSLNVFKQKNPFQTHSDKTAAADSATLPLGKAVAGAVSSANDSVTGSSGSSSSGGTAVTSPGGKSTSSGTQFFTYTVDVRFGVAGHAKTYKGVQELQLLPDDKAPIISFYGVKDGSTAIFFIYDPAFSADGEGTCKPSGQNCRFLYLKKDDAHNEETMSAENGQVQYDLTLTGVHVRSIGEDKAVGDSTPAPAQTPTVGKRARLRAASRKRVPDTLLTIPRVGMKR